MNRRLQLSAVALAVLIATALFWVLAPSSSRASFAFGDVKEAVSQARSMSCTLTTTGWKGDPWPDPYVRKSMALEPGRWRSQTNTGEVQIFNFQEGRFLRMLHKERKAEVHRLYPPARDGMPTFGDFSRRLRDIPAAATRKIAEKEVDGRRVIQFLLKEDGDDHIVTVDAGTKLPVRIEVSRGKNPKGDEIREVYSDFVFDAEIDPSLFSTVPPEGYQVEERVPDPSCDSYPEKDAETLVLSATEGMGPVKLGMATDEIIRLLGKPDWISRMEGFVSPHPLRPGEKKPENAPSYYLETLQYDSRGFHVSVNTKPDMGMTGVRCFNQHISGPMVRDFVGRTKEGVKLGASRDDVLKAYGEPEYDHRDTLRYIRLGWEFQFRDDELCQIGLTRPPPKEIQIRVLSDGSILQAVPGADIDAMIDENGNLKEEVRKRGIRPPGVPARGDKR